MRNYHTLTLCFSIYIYILLLGTDGAEDVESTAISNAIKNARIYGVFAHGELGPTAAFSDGFPVGPNSIPCTQHSMTSILSLHTEPN